MGGDGKLYVYFLGSFFTFFSAAFVEIFEEDNHSKSVKKNLWFLAVYCTIYVRPITCTETFKKDPTIEWG